MRTRATVVLVSLVVAALSSACSDPTVPQRRPRSPAPASPDPAPAPTSFTPSFPEPTRPSEIYLGPSDLYTPQYFRRQLESRYVLADDGTFALQFAGVAEQFEYKGRWTRAGSVITFDWDGWSTAGPWGATGTLDGNRLVVRYNLIMQLTDFVDGTYVRLAPVS